MLAPVPKQSWNPLVSQGSPVTGTPRAKTLVGIRRAKTPVSTPLCWQSGYWQEGWSSQSDYWQKGWSSQSDYWRSGWSSQSDYWRSGWSSQASSCGWYVSDDTHVELLT